MLRTQRWCAPTVAPVCRPFTSTVRSSRQDVARNASTFPAAATSHRLPKPAKHVHSVRAGFLLKRGYAHPQEQQGDTVIYEQFERSPSLLDDQEVIDTSSLEETLRAHREANKNSVPILKRFSDAGPNVPRPRTVVSTEARHLVLQRDTDGNTKTGDARTDYKGQVRPLSFDWEIIGDVPRSLRLPWLHSLDMLPVSRASAKFRLRNEIKAADAYFAPTQKEREAALQALDEITAILRDRVKGMERLDLIGSRKAGLATPLSDLDLNIVMKPSKHNQDDYKANDAVLNDLYKKLRFVVRSNVISTSYYAMRAKVPIIVGRHNSTGLEFQIQCASSGYGTLEVTKCYAAEFPTIKALFKIVKHMLKIRGLGGGISGGLTSYPLLNMLAVSLKLHAATTDRQDVGTQLLQFLEYFANFDFYKEGITHEPSKHFNVEPGALFENEDSALECIDRVTQDPMGAIPTLFNARAPIPLIHEPQDNFMMKLHDPANPYNDLGRAAYLIKHIQATFMDVHAKVKEAMADWDRQIRVHGQVVGPTLSLLAPLIEGDYSLYKLERKRLTERPG